MLDTPWVRELSAAEQRYQAELAVRVSNAVGAVTRIVYSS